MNNIFEYQPIVVQFTGKDAAKTVYNVHIKNLRDSIQMLFAAEDKEKLLEARRELLNLIAEVEDVEARLYLKGLNNGGKGNG